jgi:hypothetical protein
MAYRKIIATKKKVSDRNNCRGRNYNNSAVPPTLRMQKASATFSITVPTVSHTDAMRVLFALESPFGQLFSPRSHHPRLSLEKEAGLLFFLIGLMTYYIIEKRVCQ